MRKCSAKSFPLTTAAKTVKWEEIIRGIFQATIEISFSWIIEERINRTVLNLYYVILLGYNNNFKR